MRSDKLFLEQKKVVCVSIAKKKLEKNLKQKLSEWAKINELVTCNFAKLAPNLQSSGIQ